ncbi:proline--tRNA ligase [Candidatus Woesearchaeota archaeon]|jgi:prolyl-tRNA synthetase|nr:proline--tRNA ligase [Candidatus Woesearchaeota archaeon]
MKEEKKEIGLTVKKSENMPEWYSQVVQKSELAEHAPAKGCYVIRPLGYFIWECIQQKFDKRIKELGVDNTYFPMFIPESFFQKEAAHFDGFTPELAWVANRDEGCDRLALRPTSEAIMCDSFSKWVRSWRDLPLRINQWCNVVRWETKATKLFLRSREFLWQEGHCVYATEDECDREVLMMLEEYDKLCKDLLALPVMCGRKTEKEKFAGAKATFSIEAFLPDGKAIQAGTSHNLGQGFMKAFDVSFLGQDGEKHTPFHSSWGISTRLIGTAVMMHGDDKGLVLPPRIARNQVVIIPIIFEKTRDQVIQKAEEIYSQLKEFRPVLDDREEATPGAKYHEWELKGVPIRIEIGPRDLAEEQVVLVRRDNSEKQFIKIKDLKEVVAQELDMIHDSMYKKAMEHLTESQVEANDWDSFVSCINARKLVKVNYCEEPACEDMIKEKTGGASSRNIQFGEVGAPQEGSTCFHCGKPATCRLFFSKSY